MNAVVQVTSSSEPFWACSHTSDASAQIGLHVTLSIIGLYSALLKLSNFVTSVVIPNL